MRTRSVFSAITTIALMFTAVTSASADPHHRFRRSTVIDYTVEPDNGPSSIALVAPRGGTPIHLSLPVDAAAVSRLSPDGRRLVTATFTNLGLRPATLRPDGGHFKLLTVPGVPSTADVSPCIWATRTQLLCSVRTSAGSIDGVYKVSSNDRRRARRLTFNPYPPSGDFGGGDVVGDVSPNGRRFVFMRARPAPPPGQPDATQSGALFLADVRGGGVHRITPYGLPNSHDNGVESWSPRGGRILFGTEDGLLDTIRVNGSDPRTIRIDVPHDSFAYAPVWSPNGGRIAFGLFRAPTFRSDIYTAEAWGGKVEQLTHTKAVDDFPDWGHIHRRRGDAD